MDAEKRNTSSEERLLNDDEKDWMLRGGKGCKKKETAARDCPG
jgi:hypothetical protein